MKCSSDMLPSQRHSLCEFHPGHRDAVHRAYPHALPAPNAAGIVDHNRVDLGPMGCFRKPRDGAGFIGLDFFHQLDAVPGCDINTVPAVDAPLDVDFVMEVAEVAALRLLLRLLRRQTCLHLDPRVTETIL